MAYVKQGSLQVSPSAPTVNDVLTFSFLTELDWGDTVAVLGFNTTFYILYKKSSSTIWNEFGSWKCNGCFPWGSRQFQTTVVTKSLPSGTYDFLAIDNGDFKGKLPPYDETRTATRKRLLIKPDVTSGGTTGDTAGDTSGDTTPCDKLNRSGSFDPTCILETGNEQYLYALIGLGVILLLTSGGGKK